MRQKFAERLVFKQLLFRHEMNDPHAGTAERDGVKYVDVVAGKNKAALFRDIFPPDIIAALHGFADDCRRRTEQGIQLIFFYF